MFSYFPLSWMQLLFSWALASWFASVGAHSLDFPEWEIKEEPGRNLQQWTQPLLHQTRAVERVMQIYWQCLLSTQPAPCSSKALLSRTLPGSSLEGTSLFPCAPVISPTLFTPHTAWVSNFRMCMAVAVHNISDQVSPELYTEIAVLPSSFQSITAGALNITMPVWETHSTCDFC